MPSTAASSRLDHLSVSLGKQVRLRRLLYNYGGGDNVGGEFSSRDYGLDWQPLL